MPSTGTGSPRRSIGSRCSQIQSAYLRASLERTAQLTRRYLEVSQAVMTSAASTAQRQAKKAA